MGVGASGHDLTLWFYITCLITFYQLLSLSHTHTHAHTYDQHQLQTASEVKKWIPSIRREVEYLLQVN